ncbi:WD40 repeat domain-containing protein [Oligoflexus tunisiensis]|uniref:WD40 repeat domain-containing protein n=1 Tax=Oligoflexus tunisiensis TaxID=708132 RepID=UPI00114CAC56|nr:WD40 repeat domain-containing protein [Oligoflexus tunisiensis]
MRLLRILVVAAVGLLSNNCTKLKNRVLPVSYTCGEDASNWSERFVKVYDSQDEGASGRNISAQLSGLELVTSEKGCVQIPEDKQSGVLTIRDNRPSKQEGKIFSIDELTYPASVRMEVLSALVPQINCAGDAFATNSTKLDISVAGPTLSQRERFKFKAALKKGESSTPIHSTLDETTLRVDLGEILVDGDYQIEVISADELRREESVVKVCRIRIDRTVPTAGVELPRVAGGGQELPRVKTDEKIRLSSDDSSSEIFVSIVSQEKAGGECSGTFIPAQLFETPKQGRWLLCYYSRDPAGNTSKVQSIQFEIDEEPRRVLIEKLIDNAKLNAEKFRYEAAQESIERAYSEWKKLALMDDQKALIAELKSGFYEVIQRSHLKGKKAIETYAAALPLGKGRAVIFRETDMALISMGKDAVLSGQADLGMVEGFAVDPGKKRFAVGDSDGRVRVIDEKLKTVLDYEDPDFSTFQNMAFSKNGSLFAAGSVYGSLMVWDLSGKRVILEKALEGRIHGLAFDPKSEKIHVAADVAIKSITLDAANTEVELATFDEGIEGILPLDDKTLLVHTAERLTTIDLISRATMDVFSSREFAIEDVRLSPDGKFLSARTENGTVRVFSREKFTEVKSPELASFKTSVMALNDSRLAVVDESGFIRAFNLPGLEPSASFRLAEGEAIHTIWFGDANILYSNTSNSLAKWDLSNPLLKPFPIPAGLKTDEISDASFSAESVLQLAFRDGTLVTVSGGKAKTEKTADGIGFGYTVIGHNTLIRFGFETAMIFNRSNPGTPVKIFKVDETTRPESFLWNTVDDSFFLGSEGYLRLYNTKGEVNLSLQTVQPPYPVLKIAEAEDGGPIISGGERRGVISIWADRNAMTAPKEFDAHELKVTGLTFVGRENRFISASEDGALGLWAADGASIRKVSAHPNEVRQLAVHPTDGEILTIGDDTVLRVWGQDLKALSSISLPAAAQLLRLARDNGRMAVILENGQAMVVPSSLEELHKMLSRAP